MKKSVLAIIVILVAVAAIIGLMVSKKDKPTANQTATTNQVTNHDNTPSDETTPVNEPATESDTVDIQNSAFSPSKITVKKGTTVTWTNKDSRQHTVTPDDETLAFQGSELLAKNETYSVTFNTAGTFSYHCNEHPDMQGTVVVTD